MSEKEMNLAILNKLYEIADNVFNEGVNVKEGNYTASDLAKMKDSAFKDGYLETENKKVYDYSAQKIVEKDCFVAPMASVNVLSFVCSFCVVQIFALVAKFEKLAGIPTKDRQLFVAANNVGNVLRTFEVEINKNLGTLAKFVDMKDDLRPLMKNVCLDIRNHRAVASNGHVLQVRQFAVCAGSAWDEVIGYNYPLIRADIFKKMCTAAGKGAKLICKLVGDDINSATGNHWICECKDITSKVDARKYPNYESVMPSVDVSKLVNLDKKTWMAAKKWIKSSSVTNDILVIKHEEGSAKLTFKMRDLDFEIENVAEFNCVGIPYDKFALCVKASTLVKVVDEFNLYLPQYDNQSLIFIADKKIELVMPLILPDEESSYCLAMTDKKSAFYIANFPTKEQIALLDGSANNRTQSVIPAKVDNVTTEENECATEEKNKQTEQTDCKRDMASKIIICGIPSYKDSAPAKDVAEAKVDAPDAPNAPANVVPLDKPNNKFSFDAIGVNVGDALTFIDGTKVIAAEDNKVSFCGKLFTLSGFCKEFMPDDKRTKSNTYRGCAFFFKDGVKLEKLFKDAQKKTLVSRKEEIAAVPDDTPSEPIDCKGKVFIDSDNKVAYKVCGYNTIKYPHYLYTEIRADGSFLWHGGTEKSKFEEMISNCAVIEYTDENTIMDMIHEYLNAVPNEHLASEKCTDQTITQLAKENVSERKETASTAKVVAISIGVPVCLDIPPNNMRLDIAANKPFNAVVGDCLCGVDKVVHTLPLPPPRSKRISEITKVNQLIKKQKWKKYL